MVKEWCWDAIVTRFVESRVDAVNAALASFSIQSTLTTVVKYSKA